VYDSISRTAWTGNFLCHAGIPPMLLEARSCLITGGGSATSRGTGWGLAPCATTLTHHSAGDCERDRRRYPRISLHRDSTARSGRTAERPMPPTLRCRCDGSCGNRVAEVAAEPGPGLHDRGVAAARARAHRRPTRRALRWSSPAAAIRQCPGTGRTRCLRDRPARATWHLLPDRR
jgi:hypothetical protein